MRGKRNKRKWSKFKVESLLTLLQMFYPIAWVCIALLDLHLVWKWNREAKRDIGKKDIPEKIKEKELESAKRLHWQKFKEGIEEFHEAVWQSV